MNLETVKLSELHPLEKNVRKHSQEQIRELARSIEQFGQTRAFVIDENGKILVGNGMYEAYKLLGYETAECLRMNGLTEIQKKKLVLSDNKVFSLGFDDYAGINDYIKEIVTSGDLDIAGFDTMTLEMLSFDDGSEEIQKVADNYGTVNPDHITGTKNPEPKPEHPSAPTNPEPERPSNPAPSADEPHEERKSIICPNCGEVIYLD